MVSMNNKRVNLLRSLVSISGMTLISRVLGFMRDMLQANYFGAGFAADAFFVAFKLPNLLRRIFAEGAFSQAFVPVLAEHKNQQTHAATREFVAAVFGMLSLALGLIVAVGIMGAALVIWLTAPGFTHDPAQFNLAITLLRITFPYILFISLASLLGGILNTWGIFSVPAFTPTILNLSFIFFIVVLRQFFTPPILTLAWATLVGGVLQLAFQVPYLRKIDMLVWPRFNWQNPAVRKVLKLMAPAIFAVSIAQISMVINTIYASFLPAGSISWMYYADRLMELPTGVLGVALGTILLPGLSRHASVGNREQFSRLLDWGLRLCLLLALPAAVGLGLLAKPLTMTLFMRGKFNSFDVSMTSYALMAYAMGLLGLIMVKVLAPGFYANQDIKTPVKIALWVLCGTQLMNLAFIGPLRHAGLALAIGLSACLNAACLAYCLIKKNFYQPQSGWQSFLWRLISAVLLMAVAIEVALYCLPLNFSASLFYRVISLAAVILIGISVYFSSLWALNFRLRDFSHRD